ncbi:AraC family transcriptional regulator [Pontiellaceae bacterium B12219]|nr:AraC family transcriptional regulator [Pontiellaceae bacterium B12219]
MNEQEIKNNRDALPFEKPHNYDLKIATARLRGSALRVRAGIRLHEVELLPDSACRIPVSYAHDAVWFGYIRRGEQSIHLPDLGRKTVGSGGWFIGRMDEMVVLTEKEGDVALMAFSFCPHIMKSLLSMCAVDVADALHCFACRNQQKPTLIHGDASPRLQWLSDQISIATGSEPGNRLDLEARCLEWISELFKQPSLLSIDAKEFGCSNYDVQTLRDVARYLEEHLAEEHSLADLCRRFFINEFKLKRNFKALFGKTVFGYLRDLRFQHAEQLLKTADLSVLEIANEVGYSNPSHFSRGFQERYGVLPKAFRRMHQEQLKQLK